MINSPRHIAIICSRLDPPGGIEKAIVNLANLFTEHGQTVTLVIADNNDTIFYPLDPVVRIIRQPLSFGISPEGTIISRKIQLLSDVLKLRKIIKQLQPDLIIATEYPFAVAAILCGAKKMAKLISWEHHHFNELKKNRFWNKLFHLTYPKLDAVVCLNEEEKELFASVTKNAVIIPNFIKTEEEPSRVSNKNILTVARLTTVKGIDLLLPAAKTVLEQNRDWNWKIIGNGELEKAILDFIATEGLEGRLILQKPLDHAIHPEYQHASLYVMSSRNECFPMVLLEAGSAGIPCIAFDCETGPRHIINQGENGLLVTTGDSQALALAINTLITDSTLRKKMGEKALQNIKRFSPERIYALWKQFL